MFVKSVLIAIVALMASLCQGQLVMFCTGINLTGTCVNVTSYGSVTLTSASPLYNAISSIEVFGTNVWLNVFPTSLLNARTFIFTGRTISDLRYYFGLNDDIQSFTITTKPSNTTGLGITLYEHFNFEGLSAVLIGGKEDFWFVNLILDYGGYSTFPNDAMSSYVMQPYTRADFYSNTNYGGFCYTTTNPTANVGPFSYVSGLQPACMNDGLSSILISPCYSTPC